MVVSKAVKKARKKFVKNGQLTQKGQKQLQANQSAQQQSLFGANNRTKRNMKRAFNGGKVVDTVDNAPMGPYSGPTIDKGSAAKYKELRQQHESLLKEHNQASSDRFSHLKSDDDMRFYEQGRAQSNAEIDAIEAQMNKIKSQREAATSARSAYDAEAAAWTPTKSVVRNMTGGERVGAAWSGTKEYMWGGTGKQIAARNGAAAAGIIGVGVGLDALNNN